MVRKSSSPEKEILEILADSNSDSDSEIYTYSNDSTTDSDKKAEEPPSKKKRREFLNWKSGRFVPKSLYYNNENAGKANSLELGNDPIDYF